ncbi:phosphoribosylglycinamide formyltransferase [Thiosulfatimonas sediminis]|uniref:Phosphoribosylglycinamide formyltransferase n=1 Tax=Thiosulfatimonas sediminis TaxID=2675054 RepID=A0A6F8PVR4_9GAMM|nr:phosphoribosylglycinamide formyltransferase [Thiosulfatimonas sediminis]
MTNTTRANSPKKIAVLISGNGSNLQALIDDQTQVPELYEIALVVSNRPDAFGLKRAQQAGIPSLCIDHTAYDSREAFDATVQNVLEQATIDFVVLAGFMRILTQAFTRNFLGKMVNIHPSLLPKYTGLHTHRRALEAGESEHGLSIHFVTPELDGGPVILQAKVAIEPDETEQSLQQKVYHQEHIAYPLVIRWLCRGEVSLADNHVIYQQRRLEHPLTIDA